MIKIGKQKSENILRTLSFCSGLPALFLGVYTMYYFQVPKSIWLMNIAFVLLAIALGLITNKLTPVFSGVNPKPVIAVSILLLLLTFLSEGQMNVHRWLDAGNIKLNVGVIVAPLLLIQIHRLTDIKSAIFVTAIVTIIFLMQPDASQVTAFSIAAALLLAAKIKDKTAKIFILLTAIVCLILTWSYPDKLPPVNYVENIIEMAGEINPLLMVFALPALILVPLPFFTFYHRAEKLITLSLGVYFSLSILSVFAGNFPVMIMGYGISPIIGYYIGLTWLVNRNFGKRSGSKNI